MGLLVAFACKAISNGHTVRDVKAGRKTPCPHLIKVQTFNLEEVVEKINVIRACKTCFLF